MEISDNNTVFIYSMGGVEVIVYDYIFKANYCVLIGLGGSDHCHIF